MFSEDIVVFSETNNSFLSVFTIKDRPASLHSINTYSALSFRNASFSSEVGSSLYDISKLLKFSRKLQ